MYQSTNVCIFFMDNVFKNIKISYFSQTPVTMLCRPKFNCNIDDRPSYFCFHVFSARDLWKKRYFDEKKKTNPLEEQSNRLRHELDIIHKKLLSTLEGPKEKATKLNDIKPSGKVGSPGRPLVSPSFQTSRSLSPSPPSSPVLGRGHNTERQQWSDEEVTSPVDKNAKWPIRPFPVRDLDRDRSPSPPANYGRHLSPIAKPLKLRLEGQNNKSSPRYEDHDNLSPKTQAQSSPRFLKPPKMTTNQLNQFQNEYLKRKNERRQYPIALIGSDQKAEYLENDQFDSDYGSNQSSSRSNLGQINGSLTDRKFVKFDKNAQRHSNDAYN